MRASELRLREDLDGVLRESLSAAWSVQYGRRVEVGPPGQGRQIWHRAWPFDLYHVSNPSPAVRRFMRRQFQYSHRLWRTPLHLGLAWAAASRPGLRLFSRPAFAVEPPIPSGDSKLVFVGNQRVRIFDFETRRIRVAVKAGYASEGLGQELAFRRGPDCPEFVPPVLASDLEAGWFEEPLLEDHVPLPRLAPWLGPDRHGRQALAMVERWSAGLGWRLVDAKDWAQGLVARIRSRESWDAVRGSPGLDRLLEDLAARAVQLGQVHVGWTHGDFQPGNVLAHVRGGDLRVIDWEHRAQRYAFYDRVVYETALRWGGDLRRRCIAFVTGRPGGDRTLPAAPSTRRAVLAMVALEDILWRLDQAARGRFPPEWPAMARVAGAVQASGA